MVSADTHAHFAPLKPAVERCGAYVLGGDSSADPSPGLWGSPGSVRAQRAASLSLETRRSLRGRNPANRAGRQLVGWRQRRTSSWRHWWKENRSSPKSVWRKEMQFYFYHIYTTMILMRCRISVKKSRNSQGREGNLLLRQKKIKKVYFFKHFP